MTIVKPPIPTVPIKLPADCNLLPCPFCGGGVEVEEYWGSYRFPSYCVYCKICDFSLDGDNTPEEAATRWNRRNTEKIVHEETTKAPDMLDARIVALEAEGERLREALSGLYEHTADYIRINHLGDVHHNQVMKTARAVLTEAFILQSTDVLRCAECDCKEGGETCNWIKPGPQESSDRSRHGFVRVR